MKIARGAAFDSFLNRLRDEKFVIGVDRLIRVEQVLRTYGDTLTPRELRSRLCPLIASSQQQQERFDRLFKDWFLAEPEEPKPPPRRFERRWFWPVALLVLIFAAGAGLDLWNWYNAPIPRPPMPRQILGYNSPQALISAEPSGSGLPIGKPIVLNGSRSVAYAGAPVSYRWTLSQKPDGSRARLSRATQVTTTLAPDLPGAYTVQLTVYDGIAESNPYGFGIAVGDLPVPPPATDTIFPGFDRWTHSTTLSVVNLAPLRWLVIPLVLTFAYFVRRYWRRRVILDRFRQADRERSHDIRTLTLPADARTEATAAAALRSLRRPMLGRLRLSIPKSVGATIRNGGFPSLIFESSRLRPEYLVLIDTLSTRDHQSTLFQTMIRSLGKHGLQVFAYLYAGDPRVCRPMAGFTRGGPKSLNDLVSRHAGARVMIFGDAGQLFFEGATEVQPWVQPAFNQWPERFIFTPKTADRWSDREGVLKKELHFELLPATQDSLRAFAISGAKFDFYEPSWDYANAESLRGDLDPQVYQWLCACALYPRLEWILTVRLGLALELYSEQNCLQLIRLPWFRQGEMPVDLQQALVESMKPEERNRARQAILQLLNEARQGETSSEESRIKFEIAVQELDVTPKERQQIRRDLAVARRALKSDKAWYLQLPAHLRNLLMIDSRWMSKRTWPLLLIGTQALLIGGLSMLGTVGWGKITQKHLGPPSPDITGGNWLATASDDKTARVMEAPTGVEVSRFSLDSAVTSLAYRPDGKWLATGSGDGALRIIDVQTGKDVAVFFAPPGRSPRVLSTTSLEIIRRRIEEKAGAEPSKSAAYALTSVTSVTSVVFSPDGKRFAASRLYGNVVLFETSTWRQVWTESKGLPIYKIVFSPDGNLIATAQGDNTARVLETATGREVSQLTHQAAVSDVAFSPDGKWVATASLDKTARVFEAATGKEIRRLILQSQLQAVTFSPDGKWVATASNDSTARVFEAATGKEVSSFTQQGDVRAVTFSPDGKWAATASGDKTARVFEAATGKEVSRFTFQDRVNAVAFSSDGKWVAAASDDKSARVFEAATGKEVSRLNHGGRVNAIAFSPRGIKSPESIEHTDIAKQPALAVTQIVEAQARAARKQKVKVVILSMPPGRKDPPTKQDTDAALRSLVQAIAPNAEISTIEADEKTVFGPKLVLFNAVKDGVRIVLIGFASDNPAKWASAIKSTSALVIAPESDGPPDPSRFAGVFVVGDPNNSFGTSSEFRSISAPGEKLTAIGAKGQAFQGSGEAYSAAVVAGIAALVLGEEPQLTTEQLTAALESTARSNKGLVNALAALNWRATTHPTGSKVAIRGIVTNASGAGIPQVSVSLRKGNVVSSWTEVFTATDAKGAFVLDRDDKFRPGAYRLIVYCPGFKTFQKDLTLYTNVHSNVSVVLEAGQDPGSTAVNFVNQTAQPVEVFWQVPSGESRAFGLIAPGATRSQLTGVQPPRADVWYFRQSGQTLGTYTVPNNKPGQQYIIKPQDSTGTTTRFDGTWVEVNTPRGIPALRLDLKQSGSQLAVQISPRLCVQGLVWREANPTDHVCVTAQTRAQAAADNAARDRSNADGTCVKGFVWREADSTDHVCVTPQTRAQAAADNASAADTVVQGTTVNATVKGNEATWISPQGCAKQYQKPGYNYDKPGSNIYTLILEDSKLLLRRQTRWTAPCVQNAIGGDQAEATFQRESPSKK